MITSEYKFDTGLLHTRFDGHITVDDMFVYFNEVKQNTDYPRKLKIFLDASNVVTNFSEEQLSILAKVNWEIMDYYDNIWVAYIVKSPTETAISFMYRDISQLENFRFKIFSTEDGAFEWLERISKN